MVEITEEHKRNVRRDILHSVNGDRYARRPRVWVWIKDVERHTRPGYMPYEEWLELVNFWVRKRQIVWRYDHEGAIELANRLAADELRRRSRMRWTQRTVPIAAK